MRYNYSNTPVFVYKRFCAKDRWGLEVFLGYRLAGEYSNIIDMFNRTWYVYHYRGGIINSFESKTRFSNHLAVYVLKDELGEVIDPAVIEYYCRQYGRDKYNNWYTKKRNYEFRAGPVPGISHAKWRRYHRKVRTTAEHRENAALECDEDALEYGIKTRGDRRGHNLPTSWDDQPRSRERSWKSQRRTQWKSQK